VTTLAARFADGSVLLWIVALVVVEAAIITWLWARKRIGWAPSLLFGQLASGASLMLAVRAAILDQPWTQIALWLVCALIAHVVDLVLRYRAQASSM
jgi:CBS-domain-containing membrane protein